MNRVPARLRPARFVYGTLMALGLLASLTGADRCAAADAGGGSTAPQIDVSFDRDALSGHELIRAQAQFPAREPAVFAVFAAITEYPRLHAWIHDTTQVPAAGADRQEFLIEFKFPWPVGRRWSRIAVRRQGRTRIAWHQIDGSLELNRGHIAFDARAGHVHIDYQASIGVGVPDAWTRHYKRRFVSEFLNAVYQQAVAADRTSGLTVASSRQP